MTRPSSFLPLVTFALMALTTLARPSGAGTPVVAAVARSAEPAPGAPVRAGGGAPPAHAATPGGGDTRPTPVRGDDARAVFELFKGMAGEWRGRSTKGWTDTATVRVIAGGSVVTSSSFDAHPGETMLTTFAMDGDRLLLTHYCVARNQPRLVASAIDGGGKVVTFTFLDATNLPSRDKGHMDKAVYRFMDADHVMTRWTWYQDGVERWMEEIEMERVSAAGPNRTKAASSR